MSRCPNCNAELTSRPCGACGWPESTEPTAAERRRVKRALAAHQVEDHAGGGCGTSCALGLGVISLLLAIGFFKVGQATRWTSDGPGMLFVYLGFGFFTLTTITFLGGALGGMLLPRMPWWVRMWFDED